MIVHWNPRRRLGSGRLSRHIRTIRRVNNFGDLLGPVIVERVKQELGLSSYSMRRGVRLLTVGSILHLAKDGDVIWGTGRNGKKADADHAFTNLDVRALRGPRSADFLSKKIGHASQVWGDPGLLVATLMPADCWGARSETTTTVVIPNFEDLEVFRGETLPPNCDLVSPLDSLSTVMRRILSAKLVVGSSLHAIIVADAYGIPARFMSSSVEDPFKYDDYLTGTSRPRQEFAATISEAIDLGGHDELCWDSTPLMDAFPRDIWAKYSE